MIGMEGISVFNKEWLESLIELQKKSRELTEGLTWPKEYLDMVMEAIQDSVRKPPSFNMPVYSRKFKSLWNVGIQSVHENIFEPKINITETANAFLVKAAIPGLKDKDDICVRINGNVVNISGRISADPQQKDKKDFLSFNKSIPLPAEVNPQKSTAKYSDEILTLYLPKAAEAHMQQIEVTFH